MPVGRPAVGELWQSVDSEGRVIRGVISEMLQTIVTLVSATGNRYRVAPSRLLVSWTYEAPPPRTPFVCSRRGCSSTAVFQYSRGMSPDYVCPRHAPSGTRLELLNDDPNFGASRSVPASRASLPCPACHSPDPIEDRSLNVLDEVMGWSCLHCNNRWFTIRPTEDTTFVGNWWLDNIRVAIDELFRLQRPAGVIEAHPSAHAEILRVLMSRSRNIGVPVTPEGTNWMLFNIPVVLTSSLESYTVLVRPTSGNPVSAIEDMMTRPLADTLVRPGSRWIHRAGGRGVEAVSVKDGVVTFRQNDQPVHMVLEDFLSLHRPFALDNTPSEPLNIAILPGEEYEGPEGLVRILAVDSKRELVDVVWPDGRKRMPLQLREFATSKWRKIERRTAYQRIMDDEDD